MTSIIEPNRDLNTVVIVFSDGVEDGDPSGDILAPGEAAEIYQNGVDGQSVPIVFVHLGTPTESRYQAGRSAEFQILACRSGGEYLYLDSASEFLEDYDLLTAVTTRIEGVWRLIVDTNLSYETFEPGGYLLSTSLTVTLDSKERTKALQRSENGSGFGEDSRLWLRKGE